MNIVTIVHRTALQHPDVPALVEGADTLTYAALERRIEAGAVHLRALGVRPGDTVLLAIQSALVNVVTMFAVMRLGAAACNVDWRARPAELAAQVGGLAPRLTLLDRPVPDGMPGTVLQIPASWESAPANLPDLPPHDDEATALLLLSSGTTGRPLAVRLSHRAALWRGLLRTYETPMNPGHRSLMTVGLTATTAIHSLLGQLLAGATTYFFPVVYAPEELLEALQHLRIEQTTVVPTVARWMLDLPWHGQPLLPDIAAFRVTGAAFHPHEKLAVMERITPNLYEAYGSAGAGFITIATPQDIARRPESVGVPSLSVEVEIVDEQERLLPAGQTGRIRIRGEGVAGGYAVAGPDDDRGEAFTDSGYFPGDLGHLDADGYLHIDGRAASLIIRGGQNVHPEEIERILAEHAAVAETAVVGLPDPTHGELPVALVVTRAAVAAEELQVHCRARLQSYKQPARFVFVDALPRNATGKIQRSALAALVPEDVR